MNIGVWTRMGLVLLAAGCAIPGDTQRVDRSPDHTQASISVPAPSEIDPSLSGAVVREIDDPHTGDRWLLVRDPNHPGAPGRMVLVAGAVRPAGRKAPGAGSAIAAWLTRRIPPIPVIRAGDRLVVEQSTPVIEARLEAVALGPAAVGAPLNVRLAIGGNVVPAIALGPGRAAFSPEAGARP